MCLLAWARVCCGAVVAKSRAAGDPAKVGRYTSAGRRWALLLQCGAVGCAHHQRYTSLHGGRGGRRQHRKEGTTCPHQHRAFAAVPAIQPQRLLAPCGCSQWARHSRRPGPEGMLPTEGLRGLSRSLGELLVPTGHIQQVVQAGLLAGNGSVQGDHIVGGKLRIEGCQQNWHQEQQRTARSTPKKPGRQLERMWKWTEGLAMPKEACFHWLAVR